MDSYLKVLKFVVPTLLLCAWVGPGPLAQTAKDLKQAERIEMAKKEGKLVWYTGLPIQPAQRIVDAFQKKYPFIKMTFFRSSAEAMINRILTEDRAGRSSFDVGNNSTLVLLQKRGLLQPYLSPETRNFPPAYFDPNGYWTTMYGLHFIIGYNTKLVASSQAPRDWEDLLRPEWRGKIGMDKEEWLWYGAMLDYWGEERGKGFMKALAQQNIHWGKGHSMIGQLMAAGEFVISLVYAYQAEEMKNRGAPVNWVRTADPIPKSSNTLVMSAKTRSPNAARLFIDFALSPEGQKYIKEWGGTPGHPDMNPWPFDEYKKMKIYPIPPQLTESLNRYAKEFGEIFDIR
ncbi:MAG: extracellular solute-binding protein [Chloroflexi bacterium]|nr:extracellular solute-binding protein [Chloroflexota bacterium]